jgi:thymidylate synthase (FAD)
MRINVLDHGYIQKIESWGSDQQIIESARMSTDKGFLGWGPFPCDKCTDGTQSVSLSDGWLGEGQGKTRVQVIQCQKCKGTQQVPGDERLLKFLYEHKHSTPFEFAGLTIEVQAPIFVYREWHRHRTQSYTEMSGRYVTLPNLFYLPSLERLQSAKQSTTNKQASEDGIALAHARIMQEQMRQSYEASREVYEFLLGQGLARELARDVLPVAQYSRMRASANLRNWLGFLTLRTANNAQYEIRVYAQQVANIIAETFPRTYALYVGSA